MATAAKPKKSGVKEQTFAWEGKNKDSKAVRGEMRAASLSVVQTTCGARAFSSAKSANRGFRGGSKVYRKDICLFTRQLATMMKSGAAVAGLRRIVGRGPPARRWASSSPRHQSRRRTGGSLSQAFRKYPLYFGALYCNLVAAGEQASILDSLLDRRSHLPRKDPCHQARSNRHCSTRSRSWLIAFVITAIIAIFVIPAFRGVQELRRRPPCAHADRDRHFGFSSSRIGGPSLSAIGGIYAFIGAYRRSGPCSRLRPRYSLRLPLFGDIIPSVIARWTHHPGDHVQRRRSLVESLRNRSAGLRALSLRVLAAPSERGVPARQP